MPKDLRQAKIYSMYACTFPSISNCNITHVKVEWTGEYVCTSNSVMGLGYGAPGAGTMHPTMLGCSL